MIKLYINIIRKYPLILLTLGFAYGATIVFTFFGPVLTLTAGDDAPILSIIAVVFHVMGFFLRPFNVEKHPKYFLFLLILVLPLISVFQIAPYILKIFTIVLYAFLIGRVGCFWAYTANLVIPNPIRGKIISASLFISFFILYFVNMSLHLLTKGVSLILPIIMSSLSVYFYLKMKNKYHEKIIIYNEQTNDIPPIFLFVFLIMVYIAGGFSYAGIYPHFKPYLHIDRYYNVLFYLVAIILAGIVLDKYGRKIAFILGIGLLGISFTFFIMPSSVLTYIVTQTFLQAGWAFVNSFGWSFSWDMAERSSREYLFPRGISAMLLGTSVGAFLSQIIEKIGIGHSSIYGMVTFIPLFVAMILLVFFPETLKIDRRKEYTTDELKQLNGLEVLTPRELEVCHLMLIGLSNDGISKRLYISESTVKTHIRRIYNKLYLSSRDELKAYVDTLAKDKGIC